jgi:hypothetical protein
MRKNVFQLTAVFIIVLFLVSCAPEGNTGKEYGFFGGFIHGFVFLFALIGKLFGAHVGIYAENNSGFFYWLGFIFGLCALSGGGYSARRRY